MSSNPPPRRFAPTPIEQTTKSSRLTDTTQEPNKKPRRFAPEVVEETVKSSKDARVENSDKAKPRRFAPEPVENTTKSSKNVTKQGGDGDKEKPKPRRFAPQMVEETTKSSRDLTKQGSGDNVEKPKPRRFAPQMVEETQKSSKDPKPHVKFKPEVISTEYGGNRKSKSSQDSDSVMSIDDKAPRKFTPILLDTARRSRKAGDDQPPISESHKTEYAYHLHHSEHWKRVHDERAGPSQTRPLPVSDDEEDIENNQHPTTKRVAKLREPSPLDGSAPKRPSCLTPARQHSFRMPDLDTIESSESERESSPSPSVSSPEHPESPITATASESSYGLQKHATRIRESFDENYTHYLLDIERQKARQRLEEQALAAYPNPDFGYVAPDHYINNDNDSDDFEIEDRPVTWDDGNEDDDLKVMKKPRRDSTGSDWEMKEMQRHAEQAQQLRNKNKPTTKASESPWWKSPVLGGQEDDDGEPASELKYMRNGARPPMLGADIIFPRCPSPEPARFDVTQHSAVVRDQISGKYQADDGADGGLWHQVADPSITSANNSVESTPKSAKPKGLWGGFCVDTGEKSKASVGLAPPAGPTGLMTPQVERTNPFELGTPSVRPNGTQTPATPTKRTQPADMSKVDAALAAERELEEVMKRDYPDSFITQVYNYLSLGYPSIARPFDEELSKISRFSIAELRQDDVTARQSPKGYIRLGEDFEGGGGEGLTEQKCMRWQALKRYVKEWARQEKDMVRSDAEGGFFGTGVRRGSWAF